MEILRLRTFCKVVELNSFTKASEVLYLTQAAVSQHVQALERELGVTLFERGVRTLTLTDAGRRLYDYARRILELHDEAKQEISRVPTALTGEVRIAASTIPAEHILPPVLTSFRQQHPQVRVTVVVSDSEATLTTMRANQADVGVVGLKPTSLRLSFEPLVEDELVLIVPPKHRWARRKSVSLDELKREPFIARESGSGSRWCLERGLEQVGTALTDFNVILELASNEAVKEAVLQGGGVSVLSRRAVERELKARQLKAVAVNGLRMERQFYLVTNKRRVLSSAARKFLEFLDRASGREEKEVSSLVPITPPLPSTAIPPLRRPARARRS